MLRATLTVRATMPPRCTGAISPEAGREIPRTKVDAELDGCKMVLTAGGDRPVGA